MSATPGPQDVAVIIVNWNNWRLSLECLASLRTTEGARWHLFLVDNASSDGSSLHFTDLGEDVTVILADANGGWTGGNNLGLRAALDAGYARFFILNNDAAVKPDTLRLLCDAMSGEDRPPILGPVHYDPDGDLDFVGAVINPRTGMPEERKAHETNLASFDSTYETSYIRGAGIFACREHFDEVGLFDDSYYLYYDETDWCFRARAAGYPIFMLRTAAIVHRGSGSIGGHRSALAVYFAVRNGFLFAHRYGSAGQQLRHFAWRFRWLAAQWEGERSKPKRMLAILFGRTPRAIAARKGTADYLRGRFGNCPDWIRSLSGSR